MDQAKLHPVCKPLPTWHRAEMFDLKRPCSSCPFRKGVGETFMLRPDRLREIRDAVAFQCHKTVDYSGEDGRGAPGDRPQQCAGLMAVLEREGRENQIMQVARRLGADLSGLDPDGEAYESWAAVERAHGVG